MSQGSFLKTFKEKFPNPEGENHVSLNLLHELNTQKLEYFIVDNKDEPWYYSKYSADGLKTDQLSIFELNDSIYLYLGISFVGS